MLRLDPVPVETPASVDEALALLAAHGASAKVCAGGTDVIPNMKHGLHEPAVLVHIGKLTDLAFVRTQPDALELGALTTLWTLQNDAAVRTHAPALARAASLVASPPLRRMGTLGGNLALDTRCLYYNQTYFWREALGFCLKKDGTVCHVVAGGKKCVAAASNDTATMLLALDATVVLRSKGNTRTVKLEDFYVPDGVKNTVLGADELLVLVRVPHAPSATRRIAGYAKLRHRNAVDYPLLSVGVRLDEKDGVLTAAKLVVSALGARPNRVALDAFVGKPLSRSTVDAIAAVALARCTPLTNIADDPAWRKEMVPVFVHRAIDDGLARAGLTLAQLPA